MRGPLPDPTAPKVGGVPQSHNFFHPHFSNHANVVARSDTFKMGVNPSACMAGAYEIRLVVAKSASAGRSTWCPGPESNRYVPFGTRDFKSRASASFATRASLFSSTYCTMRLLKRGLAGIFVGAVFPPRDFVNSINLLLRTAADQDFAFYDHVLHRAFA